jgi:hypothetical protein
MNEARPQIPTPMRPHRIVCGNGSMLCGGAKYLESSILLLKLIRSLDAAISMASVYSSNAVSDQDYISIYRFLVLYTPLRLSISQVNAASYVAVFTE